MKNSIFLLNLRIKISSFKFKLTNKILKLLKKLYLNLKTNIQTYKNYKLTTGTCILVIAVLCGETYVLLEKLSGLKS